MSPPPVDEGLGAWWVEELAQAHRAAGVRVASAASLLGDSAPRCHAYNSGSQTLAQVGTPPPPTPPPRLHEKTGPDRTPSF